MTYNRLRNIFGRDENQLSYDEEDGSNGIDPYQGSDYFMQDQNPESYDANNPDTVMDPRPPRQSVPSQAPELSMEDALKRQYDIINRLNTPSTRASDRYNNLLDNFPKRNAPSLGRSLTAAAMTFGDPKDGFKRGQEYMYAPYLRDVAEFKEKENPFQQAATLENSQNVNERNLTTNMLNNYTGLEKIAATERKTAADNASRERIVSEKNDLAREVANGAQVSFNNGHAIVHRRDGTFYEAPVDLTNWTELEKARIFNTGRMDVARQQGQNSMNVAQQQGVNSANTATIRGGKLLQNDNGDQYFYKPGNDPEPMGDAPPYESGMKLYEVSKQGSTPTIKPPTAANERTARNNRFQKAWDENGEDVRGYLIPPDSPGKDWQLGPPPERGTFENTQEYQNKLNAYNRAKTLVLGSGASSNNTPSGIQLRPNQYTGSAAPSNGSYAPPPPPPGGQNGGPVRRDVPPANLPLPNISINPQNQLNPNIALEGKAVEILRRNGQAVTPENVRRLIQSGQVR